MSKYDFDGIQKFGAKGILLAISGTGWGAFIAGTPVISSIAAFFLEFVVNWLANKGLVVLNLGAIYFNGHFDQKRFDEAMNEGLKKVMLADGTLTPEQIKEIDDAVIAAADRFIPYTKR